MAKTGLAMLAGMMLLGTAQMAMSADTLDNGGKNPDTVNHPCQGLKCGNKMNGTSPATTDASKKPAPVASGSISGPAKPVPQPH